MRMGIAEPASRWLTSCRCARARTAAADGDRRTPPLRVPGRPVAEGPPAVRVVVDAVSPVTHRADRCASEGTLREHQPGHARPCAVTRPQPIPSLCGTFVPPFPALARASRLGA